MHFPPAVLVLSVVEIRFRASVMILNLSTTDMCHQVRANCGWPLL